MPVELSVVIPIRNAASYVPELFESLADQRWDGDWEVIVADNGSTDQSLSLIEGFRSRLPALRVVDASAGAGSAYARNVGAEAASGRAFLFVDHDDVLGEGYVAAMAGALRAHPFVFGRWEVERLNPEWTYALRPSGQTEGPIIWSYNFLPFAAGGTLGIRRELFEAVGGFDDSVWYADCTDLCWRVQLETDAELQFVPEAVIHYRYRQSLRGTFTQFRHWGRAEVATYKRYRSRGVARIPLSESLRRWGFVWHVRRLRDRAGWAWWASELGNRVGRIEGSLRERTLML